MFTTDEIWEEAMSDLEGVRTPLSTEIHIDVHGIIAIRYLSPVATWPDAIEFRTRICRGHYARLLTPDQVRVLYQLNWHYGCRLLATWLLKERILQIEQSMLQMSKKKQSFAQESINLIKLKLCQIITSP
jgi:hypothetical protein